jgi:hypothetical protein
MKSAPKIGIQVQQAEPVSQGAKNQQCVVPKSGLLPEESAFSCVWPRSGSIASLGDDIKTTLFRSRFSLPGSDPR